MHIWPLFVLYYTGQLIPSRTMGGRMNRINKILKIFPCHKKNCHISHDDDDDNNVAIIRGPFYDIVSGRIKMIIT